MMRRVDCREYFSLGMRGNATETIDAENKSRISVADEAMGLIRGALLAATHVSNVASPRIVVAPKSR